MADTRTSPYVGLVPFEEKDAPYFFGREAERELIAANLTAYRLTILYGPSGVGKSSVLRAGVAHMLRDLRTTTAGAQLSDPEHVVVVFSQWQGNPCAALWQTIEQEMVGAVGSNVAAGLEAFLTPVQQLHIWCQSITGDILVVLDQFEEYFLYHPHEGDEHGFETALAQAINESSLRVHFLIAIRDDALARLDRFKGRIPALFGNYLRLDHLDAIQAQRAIEKPLDAYNQELPSGESPITIEPQLVRAVLDQICTDMTLMADAPAAIAPSLTMSVEHARKIATPYLQLVLLRLWTTERSASSLVLRRSTLDDLGGATNIVSSHLDRVMNNLTPDDRELAAQVFRYLVTPSGTKIALTAADLAGYMQVDEQELLDLLNRLSGRERVLRPYTTAYGDSDVTRYEIFHDVLVTAVRNWRERYQLDASQARWRLKLFWTGIAALAVFTVVLLFGAWQLGRAERATHNAIVSRLSSQAISLRQFRFDRAQLLAAQSSWFADHWSEVVDTWQSRNALLGTVQYYPAISSMMRGHEGAVTSVAVSRDGKLLASGSGDQTVILWDVMASQRIGTLSGHRAAVHSVAFSPDGRTLASGSSDTTIILWDISARRPWREPLGGHERAVYSVAFSPDGGTLASGSADGTILLWDVANGKRLGELRGGHAGAVNTVAFSPDGQKLASGGFDSTIVLWDVASRGRLGEPWARHRGSVAGVVFSAQGDVLVSGSIDGSIIFWDVASHVPIGDPVATGTGAVTSLALSSDGVLASGTGDRKIQLWSIADHGRFGLPMAGHTRLVTSLAFGPDSGTMVSGGVDGAVILWDVGDRQRLGETIASGMSPITSVAFSPDGNILASAGGVGTIMLRDVASHTVRAELLAPDRGRIHSVAFGPDGKLLASGARDGSVTLWDVASGKQSGEPLLGHVGDISSVAFSPDGKTLASGGLDGLVSLWDLASRKPIGKPLDGQTGAIEAVTFSPNGRILAAASGGAAIVLWDVGRQLPIGQPLMGHSDPVFDVAFSPDGSILASGSMDQTVILWSVTDRQRLAEPLVGHTGEVYSVAFSPDGRTLASASWDNTVILWDVGSWQRLGEPLAGNPAAVASVAFSPNGKLLASGDWDGALSLWDADPGVWRTRACGIARRNLTLAEWRLHIGKAPYECTCPEYPAGEGAPADGNRCRQ